MDGCLRCLLLCGPLFSVTAAPVRPHTHTDDILRLSNTFWPQDFLFKLLKTEDGAAGPEISTGRKVLKFSIKETTCATSDNQDPAECDYKPDGVVMACVADIITDQHKNKITWQCMDESYRQKEERAETDETQISDTSQDPATLHNPQCLGCIFSLLPDPGSPPRPPG
ncbi:protegrin-5-like [Anomaloglossus baeobatrachus]|uniref:protegrin-5-like n=1 Tax=Anomaloglossus baeobatrachus TaxID=238106 RepID=UPI003F4FD06E